MAQLDVTEVLLDPLFMDIGLICERATQATNNDGIAVNTVTPLTFNAVVTSNNGDLLKRQADGEHIEASITIHSIFRLVAGKAPDITADIVTWQGSRYTVTAVNDWSQFGRGFTAATCDLIPLAGSVVDA